jgi:hypothetical protein
MWLPCTGWTSEKDSAYRCRAGHTRLDPELLLGACATCQKNDFEPDGIGGVGMAYHVHRGVQGGIRTKNGYKGCLYTMVMVEAGGSAVQTT